VFTARYGLSPHIKLTRLDFKGLIWFPFMNHVVKLRKGFVKI